MKSAWFKDLKIMPILIIILNVVFGLYLINKSYFSNIEYKNYISSQLQDSLETEDINNIYLRIHDCHKKKNWDCVLQESAKLKKLAPLTRQPQNLYVIQAYLALGEETLAYEEMKKETLLAPLAAQLVNLESKILNDEVTLFEIQKDFELAYQNFAPLSQLISLAHSNILSRSLINHDSAKLNRSEAILHSLRYAMRVQKMDQIQVLLNLISSDNSILSSKFYWVILNQDAILDFDQYFTSADIYMQITQLRDICLAFTKQTSLSAVSKKDLDIPQPEILIHKAINADNIFLCGLDVNWFDIAVGAPIESTFYFEIFDEGVGLDDPTALCNDLDRLYTYVTIQPNLIRNGNFEHVEELSGIQFGMQNDIYNAPGPDHQYITESDCDNCFLRTAKLRKRIGGVNLSTPFIKVAPNTDYIIGGMWRSDGGYAYLGGITHPENQFHYISQGQSNSTWKAEGKLISNSSQNSHFRMFISNVEGEGNAYFDNLFAIPLNTVDLDQSRIQKCTNP